MAEAQSAAAGRAASAPPLTNRRFLNPDDPVCVLLVGPSQNGKTTLINRLISMAANSDRVERGKEGDKNKKCTLTTAEYDLEVPMSQYVLIDRMTGEVVDGIASDEATLMTQWRRIKATDYAIRMADANPLYLKLHLIDTPGLDDSEGKDYENMEDVLGTLNRLSQAKEPWKRKLNAMVLVYNSNNSFSGSFQTIVQNYHKCMPNLFETMAVVNTHFDMANLSQKRLHLLRQGVISAAESARRAVMGTRAEDFKRLVGLPLAPTHFHVDNRPGDRNAYADIVSRNTIADLVAFLAASLSSPMPIKQMRVVKNPDMEMVDTKLQRLLKHATDRWSSELKDARERASDAEAFRSVVLQLRV
ncbi:hypothetical protein MAPG_01874 [Magnaporthiopsis poae ATCC 64411]|uniref:G domain-containing protein n=1 Tax=Magnaporthiopsis poae (strain ATCC 64411 / 73-15) TaxID=644358 RepID=A0A0C4DPU6_MAGP6|nr:hypothetical protein MAPG_01874 [Magnaporthiopsis poae ATCC 64411]